MRLQIAACLDSLPCLGVALFLSILATALFLSILATLAIWMAIRILDGDQ